MTIRTGTGTGTGTLRTGIWYSAPAEDWVSAVPVGNGLLGAMAFGSPRQELIVLNESSIWCGEPAPRNRAEGSQLLAEMRRLLFAGDPVRAEEVCRSDFLVADHDERRAYQPLGFLRIRSTLLGETAEYRRELDLEEAIARTTFRHQGVLHRREMFASAVDHVIVIRLSVDRPGGLDVEVSLSRPGFATVHTGKSGLTLSGQAAAEDGSFPGTRFDAVVRVIADEQGRVRARNGKLNARATTSLTILVTASSDYNAAEPSRPANHDRLAATDSVIAAASALSYDELRRRHVRDYQQLFTRSRLSIPLPTKADQPLNERLAAASAGEADPELLLLYFAYCRYLLISASRSGSLPMNLQGLWNPLMAPPWRSDWHLNINLQEAYWFAEQGNLPECHEPLFTFLEHLAPRAAETARVMLGLPGGFFAGVRTDGTLFTAPSQEPVWGMYVAGGAWCVQHVMEHFRFTQDRTFLRQRGLPLLRETARFWLAWLVEHPGSGKLVSGPSASPENGFLLPDGHQASLAMGCAHDQEIAWNSLRDFLEAANELGIDDGDTERARTAMERLALPAIGADGRLQEWPDAYAEAEPGHRHLSHLWGMMPGNRITMDGTPDLAAAVAASLKYRLSHDYHAQGWSLGWAAALLARLQQGDQAFDLLSNEYFRHAWPNMFVDAHGHVQVGDMMGAPLAIIELLLQSHTGEIALLPALPSAWATGSARGLRARGGFEIDMSWYHHKLTCAKIRSESGGRCRVRTQNDVIDVDLGPGEDADLEFSPSRF